MMLTGQSKRPKGGHALLVQKISFTAAELPPPQRSEILRYMQAKELSPALEPVLDDALDMAARNMQFSVCWREVSFSLASDNVILEGTPLASRDFARYLANADRLLLFAATTGLIFERALQKATKTSPVRALCLHAVGSERTEALCDAFCALIKKEVAQEGFIPRPRFSAGYGDLPLSLQRQIFMLLHPERQIGVSLSAECLMTPAKSVTAFVALKKQKAR